MIFRKIRISIYYHHTTIRTMLATTTGQASCTSIIYTARLYTKIGESGVFTRAWDVDMELAMTSSRGEAG